MQGTMKAIIKPEKAPGLKLVDMPIPEIGDNDVLVKIKKTAICGTDVHIYKWDEWAQRTIPAPMIIGHEFVGTIAEIGRNVKGLKIGQLVSAEGHIVCGKCRNCIEGRKHLCRSATGIGVNRDGIFAEYASIPAENIWPCDNAMPEEVFAIFDPFGNATHTALSFNVIGEDVLVTGAGPIGIMAVAILKHVGARNIVITDVNDYRLSLAKEMGATRAVNVSREKLEDVISELGMKEGFDVGLEMSGSEYAFGDMVNLMAHGGKIAMLGIQKPTTAINWDAVVFRCLTLTGIYGRKVFDTWYQMSAMLQSGLDISKIITHRFNYTEFEKGFEVMMAGESGKVVLSWE